MWRIRIYHIKKIYNPSLRYFIIEWMKYVAQRREYGYKQSETAVYTIFRALMHYSAEAYVWNAIVWLLMDFPAEWMNSTFP